MSMTDIACVYNKGDCTPN